MESTTLIERYPIISSIFGSSHPILNLLTVLPFSALLVYWNFELLSIDKIPTYTFLLVVSWFYWTFFEYGFHRWVYHGKYKPGLLKDFIDSFHIYHHRNLDDPSVLTAGPLMIMPLSLVLLLPWWFIFKSQGDYFAVMGVSLLLNYYFYEWIHFLIHRSNLKNKYMNFISEFHFHHHNKNWSKNFGNTTSIWDHLFGTYESEK